MLGELDVHLVEVIGILENPRLAAKQSVEGWKVGETESHHLAFAGR